MANIISCAVDEPCKYKLIDDYGNVIKRYYQDDEPVDFSKEVQKYQESQKPTLEERLEATEQALLTLMGI